MSLLRVTDRDQILTETKTIAGGIVQIDHLPNPAKSITIPGYSQTTTPIPLQNQFFVNYSTGVISFNSGNSGSVTVTYYSMGENVNAIYINQLITAIEALQNGSASPKLAVERIQFLGQDNPGNYWSTPIVTTKTILSLVSVLVMKNDSIQYAESLPIVPLAENANFTRIGQKYGLASKNNCCSIDENNPSNGLIISSWMGDYQTGEVYTAIVSYLTLEP